MAVVKHDAHGVQIDRPGKDSDRLFRAGADVALRSPDESVARWHGSAAPDLAESLKQLAARHDIVLVEGHKLTRLPKLWLLREGEDSPPEDVEQVVGVLHWGSGRVDEACELAVERLAAAWAGRPILGGVLVGGRSLRMGRPKQLLDHGGRTIVEGVVRSLESAVDRVVLLGDGEVPQGLADHGRIPDPPGLAGPAAGLLAALRWCPHAAWLMVSCDLSLLSHGAIRWLLEQRRPGRWAILPKPAGGTVEPLCAVYEPQALPLLERLLDRGHGAPRRLAGSIKVACPQPPDDLASQWRGVNTPEEWEEICGSAGTRPNE